MASLGELFVELGVFGDVEDLKKAEKRIESFIKKNKEAKDKQDDLSKSIKKGVQAFAGVVTAITGAVYAFNRLTNSLMDSNNSMLDLTRQSDIALSTFQKWDSVGRMFGINNAASQLENLNERLFELRLTGQGARGFQLAGIMPTNAEDVMEQLRNRIRGMDNTSATYLLKQMGLDPKMITLLRMSREEYERLGNEMKKYQLTDEQRQSLAQMNVQLQIANQKLQYLKDRILLRLAPIFIDLVESFARITTMLANFCSRINKSSEGLSVFIRFLLTRGIWKGIEKIVEYFKSGNTIIAQIMQKIPILGSLFEGLGKIFAKALLPLTALYLLLDDIAVFCEGGDSLIGEFVKWSSEKGAEIGDAFKKMFGGDLFGGLGDLTGTVLDTLTDILKTLTQVLERILNFLSFGLWDKIKEWTQKDGIMPAIVRFILPHNPEERYNELMDKKLSSTITNVGDTNTDMSDTKISTNITNYIQTSQSYDDIMRSQFVYSNAIFMG